MELHNTQRRDVKPQKEQHRDRSGGELGTSTDIRVVNEEWLSVEEKERTSRADTKALPNTL